MFNWKKPTVQMLGRWQPWHEGHTALFKKALEKTGQVAIMIRDMQVSESNPLAGGQVTERIQEVLEKEGYIYNEHYIICSVPNIIDISYGRDVGYTITQHDLGKEIHDISATKIRAEMREEGKL
tara:strand:- start:46 stop:417 length:372 start_codon:yes stop_codon:yes gene_type:complete